MDMGNYKLSALERLRMIACSSIFGEPSYYRQGANNHRAQSSRNVNVQKYLAFPELSIKSTVDVFVEAIDAALTENFKATIQFAVSLRKEFLMRLNPGIIMVRAALHPNRAAFNEANPKVFRDAVNAVVQRPDDITNQFNYYKQLTGGKTKLPGVLKRAWANSLQKTSRYQLKKYLNQAHIIDLVRICHANSPDIDEMMKTGNVVVDQQDSTWETLRSQQKKWVEILQILPRMPHMALLKCLRSIAGEIHDPEIISTQMDKLNMGVPYGKQFPFRYWSAWDIIKNDLKEGQTDTVFIPENIKRIILQGLEKCMQTSLVNFPKLQGKTISLCDNSGSAHGQFRSNYRKNNRLTVSTIGNLSGIITAMNSEKGQVGIFGDNLEIIDVGPDSQILSTLEQTKEIANGVGQATENGIWIFFRDAIKNQTHYDNIFIYSDMQAGHGGLYGTRPEEYKEYQCSDHRHIDVMKLIEAYRYRVNPKVNIFCVQIAGYDNSLMPEMFYRGSILSGWTGKEVVYASQMISLWNELDSKYAQITKKI